MPAFEKDMGLLPSQVLKKVSTQLAVEQLEQVRASCSEQFSGSWPCIAQAVSIYSAGGRFQQVVCRMCHYETRRDSASSQGQDFRT